MVVIDCVQFRKCHDSISFMRKAQDLVTIPLGHSMSTYD